MAGPAKQFDRQQVLKQAMMLFWRKGYEATSMQELVETMGVNRASLYDTFGNKEAIYHEALNNYCQMAVPMLTQLLANAAQGSSLDAIRQFLMYVTGQAGDLKNLGCFANNAAVELGPENKVIANTVKQFWLQIEKALVQVLDKGRRDGEIPAQANSHKLAQFINNSMQGLVVQSKIGLTPGEAKNTIELVIKALTCSK